MLYSILNDLREEADYEQAWKYMYQHIGDIESLISKRTPTKWNGLILKTTEFIRKYTGKNEKSE